MKGPSYMTIGEWEALDPGIRATVDALRGAGFETCDSGDGYSKPAADRVLDYAHVFIQVDPRKAYQEALRLRWWLSERWAVEVKPIGPDMDQPHIQVSWDPTSEWAIIELGGVMLGRALGAGEGE